MSESRALSKGMPRWAAVILAFSFVGASNANAEIPRVFQLASTSPAGNYLAARTAGSSRDMEAAAAFYRAALRADPANPELMERTFLVTLASGAVSESMQLAERLVVLDKTHRIARLTLAARDIKSKHYAAARKHLAQSVRGPIADLTSSLLIGWSYFGSNNVKAATATIDKLQGPDWYAVFKDLHSALILDLGNKRADAIRRIERAKALDPNALRTVDAYARILARAGRKDDALKAYSDFAAVIPRHPLTEAAVAELNAGKKLSPLIQSPEAGAAEALFGLGAALGRQGGEDLGMIYLQLAIYLRPDHPLALIALGDLFEALKKNDLAVAAYDRVPDNSPLKLNAEIQRALNLDVLDRKDEAREQLDALVKKNPKDLEALTALGNVLRGSKKFAEAAEVYSRAIDLIPELRREHWTVLYFRGICFERSKQWAAAEKDFQKALELFPDQPQVLNYLGYSWVDQGVNLDKALDMIRKAVALRPNDGYIVDSLGWAYYRIGKLQEATVELERAVVLRPEDPTINDHLGDLYWLTDRKLEARFQWQHALDMKPEPDEQPKIERKLKEGFVPEPPPSRAGEVKNPDKG